MSARAVFCSAVIFLSLPAQAETPAQWIELGTRVHGGFGAFIPIGIRIGLDAKGRIKAEPRGLVVTYSSGEKAPCPCIADGVMLATNTSPGQGTLLIAPEKALAGVLAVIVVRNRKPARACATPSPMTGCQKSSSGTRRLIQPNVSMPR
jgi:formylmethanofuran dehydrogenase subunit E